MFHGMTGNRSRADELLGAIVDEGQGEVVPRALSMWGQALIDEARLPDGLDALDEITAVCDDLDGYTGWVCGHAYYQLGEVRRPS